MSRLGDRPPASWPVRPLPPPLQPFLLQLVQALRFEPGPAPADRSPLAAFLVSRAAASPALAHWLHWYLMVACEDPVYGPVFARTHARLMTALAPAGQQLLTAQSELVAQLGAVQRELKAVKGPTERKKQALAAALGEHGLGAELSTLPAGLPSPLEPDVHLVGLLPARCSVLKSALHPLLLCFRTRAEGVGEGGAAVLEGERTLIFKCGDDLRQDQLCVGLIALMDAMLRRAGLDLRFTTYAVLATGIGEGLVEYVPSLTLAAVLTEHGSIAHYLAAQAPDPAGPYGIAPDVLDAFVRSCAGYCVVTYLLGVGDRHLDNLLLTPDGRLFHIDYGYIMGRDPKPLPPPMKLCREMVEAMGGADSEHYGHFLALCGEAFIHLRRSAGLVFVLFQLMAGANLPDLAAEPEARLLARLEEKFRLDLDNVAAVQFLQSKIAESAAALFPQVRFPRVEGNSFPYHTWQRKPLTVFYFCRVIPFTIYFFILTVFPPSHISPVPTPM